MSLIPRSRVYALAAVLFALLVLVGCQRTTTSNTAPGGINSPAEKSAVANSPVIGTWELVALGTNTAPRPVIPGTHLTAVFNADTSLRGYGGCNDYNTSFNIVGSAINVFPIAIGRNICSRDITEQESLFVSNLNQAQTFRKDGNQLIILSAGENSLVFDPR